MRFVKIAFWIAGIWGTARHHAPLLYVRSHQPDRSATDHASGILLRIRRCCTSLADRVLPYWRGPGTLSTFDDSFLAGKSQLRCGCSYLGPRKANARFGPAFWRSRPSASRSVCHGLCQDPLSVGCYQITDVRQLPFRITGGNGDQQSFSLSFSILWRFVNPAM